MIFKGLHDKIESIKRRDPAARSGLEVLLVYPGLHALILYRLAHWLWVREIRLLARIISHIAKMLTGIEIHPGAQIGKNLFIDHGTGVVIGETAVIGDEVTLYHGVTLGGTSLHPGKRHPTLEDGVIVGSGAQILGPITVGAEARIGANAVVLSDVPKGVTMVGIPARMVMQKARPEDVGFCAYGLPTEDLPDPVVRAIDGLRRQVESLLARLEEMETRVENNGAASADNNSREREETRSVATGAGSG